MLKPEDAEKVLTKNLANVIRKANTGKPLTAAERALIEQAAAGGPPTDSGSAFAKTYNELSKRFGLTRKTLQNAGKRYPEDVPDPRADGRHDVAAWSQFLIRHNVARTAENIAGAPAAEDELSGPITVTDWKAEEIKLKCEKLQLENAKVAGELVLAADVETGLSSLVAAFRQALNNMPGRLAQKILNVSDFHEAEELISQEVNVVLKTLQNAEFLDEQTQPLSAAATSAIEEAGPPGNSKGTKDPSGLSSPVKTPSSKRQTRPSEKTARSACTSTPKTRPSVTRRTIKRPSSSKRSP